MIAIRDNYPLVRFRDGTVMSYDRRWLCSAVVRAAESAGYKKWWLTPHVAESVSRFLQQDFNENIVTVSRLEKAVRSVLQVIGYSDVASRFETPPPPVRLSLADLARRAGPGYELAFFGLLRRHLAATIDSPARELELYDARAGVKLLRNAKNWTPDCSLLLNDIVHTIRSGIATSRRAHELHVQIT